MWLFTIVYKIKIEHHPFLRANSQRKIKKNQHMYMMDIIIWFFYLTISADPGMTGAHWSIWTVKLDTLIIMHIINTNSLTQSHTNFCDQSLVWSHGQDVRSWLFALISCAAGWWGHACQPVPRSCLSQPISPFPVYFPSGHPLEKTLPQTQSMKSVKPWSPPTPAHQPPPHDSALLWTR